MTLPGRFAEYGLSGAFFWICQLILLLLSGQTEAIINLFSTTPLFRVDAAPQLVQTLIVSLLAVLAIITVFTTGLLLDLCASFFIIWEIGEFKRHLDRNASWLHSLVEKYQEYSVDDYQRLRDHFGHGLWSKETWLEGVRWLLFWQRGWWRHFLATNRQVFGRPALVGPYSRLWSFFISYVVIQSGSAQLSVLTDLVSQWRVGRALTTAIDIILFEIFVGFLVRLMPLPMSRFISGASVLLLVFALFLILNALVTRALYSRVCYTLFSLAYVTKQKESPVSAKTLGGV